MSFCVRVPVFVSVCKILLNLKVELDCPSQIATNLWGKLVSDTRLCLFVSLTKTVTLIVQK